MKLLIAMPCKKDVYTETFVSCLGLKLPHDTEWYLPKDGMIYELRNKAAIYAINCGFDYVLWLDSDMIYEPNTLINLYDDNKDIVTGIFFRRKPPYCTAHMDILNENEYAELTDYPKDGLFTIEGMGTGVALTRVSALKTILDAEGDLFLPMKGLSEDYAFSIRARRHFNIWCDPKVVAGHITTAIVDERWQNGSF